MALSPIAEAQGVLLLGGERGPRQLNFADLAGQFVDQLGIELLTLGNSLHVIGESEQGIQGDRALRTKDAQQVLHHLFVDFGIRRITSQQVDHPGVRVAHGRRDSEQQLHPIASGIEQLAIAAHSVEATHDAGEQGIGLRTRNTLLPNQDLPQAH